MNCNFERLICNHFPITVGRPCGDPVGIVIHIDKRDALSIATEQATQSKWLLRGMTATGYHFVVEGSGHVLQLQNITDTVPNLHYAWMPAVTWLPYDPLSNPNPNPDPYVIHIVLASRPDSCDGMTSEQYDALVQIICCIRETYPNLPLTNIVTPDEINRDPSSPYLMLYEDFTIPPVLAIDAASCEVLGGVPCGGEVADCGHDGGSGGGGSVGAVPACCDANAAAIAGLQLQINSLTGLVVGLIPVINAAAPLAQAAYDEVQSIRLYLASIQSCLECLCPADLAKGVIEYRLQAAGDALIVTPVVNRWINFADKITDLVPERVTPGPLWTANLDGGTHNAEVSVRYAPSDYCTGCKVWLDIVQCGVRTRLAELVLTAGIQPVTISWNGAITITTPCPDLHFETGTDSTLGTPSYKVVEYASFKVTI